MAPVQVVDPPAELYDRDFHAWTRAQAAELRRLAAKLPASLDVAHLAEEIETLGRSERDAVRSQVRRILEHFLKLAFAPEREPARQWHLSIDEARDSLGDKLTPTLRHDLEAALPTLYTQGRRRALRGLLQLDEAEADRLLPSACPYRLEQVLNDDWFPERQG